MTDGYERVTRTPRWTPETIELVAQVLHGDCECGRPGAMNRRDAASVLDALASAGLLVKPAGDGG